MLIFIMYNMNLLYNINEMFDFKLQYYDYDNILIKLLASLDLII